MGGGGHGEHHGHGDHHHHEPPYVVPDYRKFKLADAPPLQVIERVLAQKGLKNPWLRNDVWRYDPGWGTKKSRVIAFTTRGMKWGVAAFLLTIAGEKAYEHFYPSTDHHQHH